VKKISATVVVAIALGVTTLAGCGAGKEAASPATEAPVAAAPAETLTLPISQNAVMVALTTHSSDAIFAAATKAPKSDDDWSELEYHAYQLVIAGKVIQLVGTGPNDKAWVSNPEWKRFAEELTAIGEQALGMAQTKRLEAIEDVGNRLIEVCEGCHKAFKPDIPSMGILLKKSPALQPSSAK
jgi:hypothetical protein